MKLRMAILSHSRRLSLATVTIVLIAGIGGCRTATLSGDAMPKRDIKTVMDSHVDELMAIPNVVGVAIGELDDGTPCIQVLVKEETDETTRKIPKTLEGHPVQIIETGEIRPMDGS